MRNWILAGLMLASSAALAAPSPPAEQFPAWLQSYRAGAIERGLKAEWVDATLVGAEFNERVVRLDRNQPDDAGRRHVFADYLRRTLTQQHIDDGRARAVANRDLLQRIGRETGVAPEIIVAIWGMETSYGRITGNFDLPSAIATLAFDARREALFTRELDALVRIIGEYRIPRSQLKGSWAGAFGQAQFLPSSYLNHAVDGDGDGVVDIWNSTADTFASIGNYLKQSGWQEGISWGFEAGVPPGFDRQQVVNPVKPTSCIRPLERHSIWLPAQKWRELGFRPLNAVWPADDVNMALIEPDGPGEGAYLVTGNYRAIMEYNCSNFYALSVTLLGNAVRSAVAP